jgi:hypothetical protein
MLLPLTIEVLYRNKRNIHSEFKRRWKTYRYNFQVGHGNSESFQCFKGRFAASGHGDVYEYPGKLSDASMVAAYILIGQINGCLAFDHGRACQGPRLSARGSSERP